MNQERHEELAALAAVDLLTPADQAELTAALAGDPKLQELIDSLRATATELARTAPAAEPPAHLKARIMANIAVMPVANRDREDRTPAPAPVRAERSSANSNVISFPSWLGWAAAACFALVTVWLAQQLRTSKGTEIALEEQRTLADLAMRSAQNQLEAERLISKRELADAVRRVNTATTELASLQNRADAAAAAFNDFSTRLTATQAELETAKTQLAQAREIVVQRDRRIADLGRELQTQGDLANYKIAALATIAGNSPQALAIAVWNPSNQQGVLRVQKLPALAADKDYQLWVIDPQYTAPVSSGVFHVDPATGDARLNFRPDRPVKTAAKFAISLETKGGSPTPSTVLFIGE